MNRTKKNKYVPLEFILIFQIKIEDYVVLLNVILYLHLFSLTHLAPKELT